MCSWPVLFWTPARNVTAHFLGLLAPPQMLIGTPRHSQATPLAACGMGGSIACAQAKLAGPSSTIGSATERSSNGLLRFEIADDPANHRTIRFSTMGSDPSDPKSLSKAKQTIVHREPLE